jgi:hypothetical protein
VSVSGCRFAKRCLDIIVFCKAYSFFFPVAMSPNAGAELGSSAELFALCQAVLPALQVLLGREPSWALHSSRQTPFARKLSSLVASIDQSQQPVEDSVSLQSIVCSVYHFTTAIKSCIDNALIDYIFLLTCIALSQRAAISGLKCYTSVQFNKPKLIALLRAMVSLMHSESEVQHSRDEVIAVFRSTFADSISLYDLSSSDTNNRNYTSLDEHEQQQHGSKDICTDQKGTGHSVQMQSFQRLDEITMPEFIDETRFAPAAALDIKSEQEPGEQNQQRVANTNDKIEGAKQTSHVPLEQHKGDRVNEQTNKKDQQQLHGAQRSIDQPQPVEAAKQDEKQQGNFMGSIQPQLVGNASDKSAFTAVDHHRRQQENHQSSNTQRRTLKKSAGRNVEREKQGIVCNSATMIESDEDDDGDRKPSLTARLEIFNRVQAIQPQREEGQARLGDAKAEKASRAVLKRRQHAHDQQQHCRRKYKKREQDIVYSALQRQYHADPQSTVAEQVSAQRDLLGTVRQLLSRKRQTDIVPDALDSVRRDTLNEYKKIDTVVHQGIDSCK